MILCIAAKDPKILLKRQYLDDLHADKSSKIQVRILHLNRFLDIQTNHIKKA